VKTSVDNNVLMSVTLDNYTKITCNAIFAITSTIPETNFISEKLIDKENGYLKTTDTAQSLLVPNCFAVGNCACKSTKKMQAGVIEAVITDLTEVNYAYLRTKE
jgi:thioredoxin reductase